MFARARCTDPWLGALVGADLGGWTRRDLVWSLPARLSCDVCGDPSLPG